MYNHLQNQLNEALGGCTILPHSACPSRFFEVTFMGWGPCIIMHADNREWREIVTLVRETLNNIISIYKDEHAFSEPVMGYKPHENMFYLKIGIIELEKLSNLSKH